jgi:hypothetical protein
VKLLAKATGPKGSISGEPVALVFNVPKSLVVPEHPSHFSIAKVPETMLGDRKIGRLISKLESYFGEDEVVRIFKEGREHGDIVRLHPKFIDVNQTSLMNAYLVEEGHISEEAARTIDSLLRFAKDKKTVRRSLFDEPQVPNIDVSAYSENLVLPQGYRRVLAAHEVEDLGPRAVRASTDEGRVFSLQVLPKEEITESMLYPKEFDEYRPSSPNVNAVLNERASLLTSPPNSRVSLSERVYLLISLTGLPAEKNLSLVSSAAGSGKTEGLILYNVRRHQPRAEDSAKADVLVRMWVDPENEGGYPRLKRVRNAMMLDFLRQLSSEGNPLGSNTGDILLNTCGIEDAIFANRFLRAWREGLEWAGPGMLYRLPRGNITAAVEALSKPDSDSQEGQTIYLVHKTTLPLAASIYRFGLFSEKNISTLNDIGFEKYRDAVERLFKRGDKDMGAVGAGVALVFNAPKRLVVPEYLSDYSIAKTGETVVSQIQFNELMNFLEHGGESKGGKMDNTTLFLRAYRDVIGLDADMIRQFKDAQEEGELVRLPPEYIDKEATMDLNKQLVREGQIPRESLLWLEILFTKERQIRF